MLATPARIEQEPVQANRHYSLYALTQQETHETWPSYDYQLRPSGMYVVKHAVRIERSTIEAEWRRIDAKKGNLRPFTIDVLPANGESMIVGDFVFVYNGMTNALSTRVNQLVDESTIRSYEVPESEKVVQVAAFLEVYGPKND